MELRFYHMLHCPFCKRTINNLWGMMTLLVLKRRLTLYLTDIFKLQNIMTFNKCSINGKAYGDVVDEYGNPMDITEVSSHNLSDHYLQCIHHCNPHFKFRTPCLRMVYFGSGLFTRYYRTVVFNSQISISRTRWDCKTSRHPRIWDMKGKILKV